MPNEKLKEHHLTVPTSAAPKWSIRPKNSMKVNNCIFSIVMILKIINLQFSANILVDHIYRNARFLQYFIKGVYYRKLNGKVVVMF